MSVYNLEKKYEIHFKRISNWCKENVAPYAAKWETGEDVPEFIIEKSGKMGLLGAMIPKKYGGLEWNAVEFGIMIEVISYYSISLAILFNVHNMVSQILMKWGTKEQKQMYLPRLACGKEIAAFALTESTVGSDTKNIKLQFHMENSNVKINGTKKWITYGNRANLFVVFGKLDGLPTACIVEKKVDKGLTTVPITELFGFKGAHMGQLNFNNCIIPQERIVGQVGTGLTCVANYGLIYGRMSVSFSALGILRNNFEEACSYALRREAFSEKLICHDLIKKIIAEMGVDLKAAAGLCFEAAYGVEEACENINDVVMSAKYFTSRVAEKHSANAVQIMGALGCSYQNSVARNFNNTKILEIIEGSTQIHEIMLGWMFCNRYGRKVGVDVNGND